MAKKQTESPAIAGVDADVTITEFCRALSMRDSRVELIGAFHAVETRARRNKDAESRYSQRYADFCNQPA